MYKNQFACTHVFVYTVVIYNSIEYAKMGEKCHDQHYGSK